MGFNNFHNFHNFLELTTLPFEDDTAVWDFEFHVYVPKKAYIEKLTGLNLTQKWGTSDFIYSRTLRLALQQKNMIMETANADNPRLYRDVKEYLMAKDHESREQLIFATVWYIEGDLQSGISAIGNEHGKDFKSNTELRFKQFDDLSEEARRALMQTDLMFRGTYDEVVDPDEKRVGY